MKTPYQTKNRTQSLSVARTLASAAVVLSLTACGGETLDSIQNDLDNGDDVDINISTNDDGSVVISVIEDDDPDGASVDTGALFDEETDGEISGDANSPLSLQLADGSNVLNGTVVASDIDYVTVNVPAGSELSAINLVGYESAGNDQSFIGIQQGTVFTEPPVDTVVGNLLGFTLFGTALVGSDILPNIGSGDGAQGFSGALPAGDYTFWIQETGDAPATWSLDLVVSAASIVADDPIADDQSDRVVGAMYALTNQHDPSQQISAADDAASEPDRVNQVVAYSRGVDGSLVELGVYDTGGVGENIRNSGANPLASQDPLIVSKDQRFVFAVNAGSESISSFIINDDFSLTPASLDVSTSGSSGAQNPVSLTIYENILYVANTGNYVDENGVELDTLPEYRNRVNSSIIGFTIGDDGTLTELAGSEIPGIAANAGSVEFSSDGLSLHVTERRTNEILSISLDEYRLPISEGSVGSVTPQPFGTDLYPADIGDILLVSEGNNGAPGLSALSSYLVESDGSLTGISLSSGVDGDPLTTGFTFGCWVEFVETPTGDFAYVSNTPDGIITSFEVSEAGELTLLESAAADVGVGGDDTQNGGGVLDAEVAGDYLYQVVNNDSRIAQFYINDQGGLERQFFLEVVDPELFIPRMFVGIAGF